MKKLQSEREFYETLGRRMRQLRRCTKQSPYSMGRAIGVHGMLYYEMERGRIAPIPYQIYRLIHICNMEMLKDWK